MNEIEKMYENCGIKPNHTDECKLADIYWNNEELADEYGIFDNYIKAKCPHNQECTDECEHAYDKENYPQFTAEKQLELIKLLGKRTRISLEIDFDNKTYFYSDYNIIDGWFEHQADCETFKEALAQIVNVLWQSLTEEEKEQIRGILK